MSGSRGKPGHTKGTGDSKYQLGIIHAHKWLLSIQWTFLLNRDHDIFQFCRLKLLVCDEDFPRFSSWFVRRETNVQQIVHRKGKRVD